jgi:hypothetical protein
MPWIKISRKSRCKALNYKNPQEVRPVGFVVAVLPATWERRNRRKSSWGRVILLNNLKALL